MTDDTPFTYTVSSLIDQTAIQAFLDQRRQEEEDAAQADIAAFREAIQAILTEGTEMFDQNLARLHLTQQAALKVLNDPEASDADKKKAANDYREDMKALLDFIGVGFKAASPPVEMEATPVSTSALVAETPDEERLLGDYRAGKVRLETEQAPNGDGTFMVLSAWSDRGIYPIISARRAKRKQEKQASAAAPAAAKADSTSTAEDNDGSTPEPETTNVTPSASDSDNDGSTAEPETSEVTPTPSAKPAPSKAAGKTTPRKQRKATKATAPATAASAATPPPPVVDTPAPPAHVADDDGSSEPDSPVDTPARAVTPTTGTPDVIPPISDDIDTSAPAAPGLVFQSFQDTPAPAEPDLVWDPNWAFNGGVDGSSEPVDSHVIVRPGVVSDPTWSRLPGQHDGLATVDDYPATYPVAGHRDPVDVQSADPSHTSWLSRVGNGLIGFVSEEPSSPSPKHR